METTEALAKKHIARYERQVELGREGNKTFNVETSLHYLNIWKSIQEKGFLWENFNEAELNELEDAVEDEM